MASKGYATPDDVAAFLNNTLSPAQEALCDMAIEAAEGQIDYVTRHAWLETGPIQETLVQPVGIRIQLAKPPLITVDEVSYVSWPGATSYPITEACGGWYLQSAKDGILIVPFAHHSYSVTVEYTPNTDPVPADIHLATIVQAASHMQTMPAMQDGVDPTLVQRYVVGGELEVEFRKSLPSPGSQLVGPAMAYLSRWVKGYSVV